MISSKVLLTGSFAVGKTSLFRRFIYNEFDEKYLTSIGVKVDKKALEANGQEVSLVIWDIAGEVSQEKVPKTYFLGASAVIYVFDLSRPQTCEHMSADLEIIKKILPGCLIYIVGNKKDLVDETTLENFRKTYSVQYFTSAKTGNNIPELFQHIAESLTSSS